jgi:phosphate transport system substrate-binding protein
MVPIFNIPNMSDLVLERSVLADIFCGNITQWNDPRIAATNPEVSLPNQMIKVFARADATGTCPCQNISRCYNIAIESPISFPVTY